MSGPRWPLVVRPATSADAAAIEALEGLSASTRRSLTRDLVRAEVARAEVAIAGAPVALIAVRPGGAQQAGPRDTAPARAVGPPPDAGGGDASLPVASDAEVVGAALGLLQHDEGHVLDLAVASELRRHGVGTRLLRALLAALLAQGARAATLEVRAGNLGAQALYRAEGFAVEGRRPGYYPDGDDAILMWWRPDDASLAARRATAHPATYAASTTTSGAAVRAPLDHASSTGG